MSAIGKVIARGFKNSANLKSGAGAFNENAAKAAATWRNISLFFAIPAVGLTSGLILWEHFQHHDVHRPEVLSYEYMRIRRSKFPWGDGNHTLFHNKEVNALPSGYEE